jgi:tryptophan halogenase
MFAGAFFCSGFTSGLSRNTLINIVYIHSMNTTIKSVAIVGGGTSGWIAAAMLARVLGKNVSITLIESEHIGTVGVGEATIPPIKTLNQALGIDEADFIKKTNATIKLGIQFENWNRQGDSYMHAFGSIGKDLAFCGFEQLWFRSEMAGHKTDFWDYSLNYQAAKQGRFAKLESIPNTGMNGLVYAYHFDAGLYAKYLRDYSEQRGVKRIEGLVDQVNLSSEDGAIESLQLQKGLTVEADLFIDCSGFKGLLIDEALGVAYEDWSHYLPCNRAVAVQTESQTAPPAYTRSIAHEAGWRWQIPLQSRVGNGLVYSNNYLSDDEATTKLIEEVDGVLCNEPRVIAFQTGRREVTWHKNCVAIGLASGFLEPLESTSIHMVQSAVTRLIKLFPHNGIKTSEVLEYNRQTQEEIEHIRDFIILHYRLNNRPEPFWQYCQTMDIPESLSHKIELFKDTGKLFNPIEALFSNVAWHQVMVGQGMLPQDYHSIADTLTPQQLSEFQHNIRRVIDKVVSNMPTHQAFLDSLKH